MDKALVGLILNSVMLSEDKTSILFKTEQGDIKVKCDADCCSHTWVENIEMPALGLPAKVLTAENIDMPNLGDMPDCDVVQYYGFKLVTDKGELVIDYRNDSNGCYGGNLSWPNDEYFYSGVYGQNVSNEVWQEVENISN
tara:strand:+ start:65 stop:484 length:420 start_codon:yes stop_codon:yes gene_type:complete